MKEINDILKAYSAAVKSGKKTALATVVRVEGSSYRRPGARMLVTEDGELTGAISGGCLEGDALRKALLAIHQQSNKLITYDTSSEDDVEFGVQLGCNGIVHILFEYIDPAVAHNPLQLLKQLEKKRTDAVIVTLFSLERNAVQPGTVLFYREDEIMTTDIAYEVVLQDIKNVLQTKSSIIKNIEIDTTHFESLIEYIAPPVSLIIAGAGNDVKPLVDMASLLGWDITIADGRATHATVQRFPLVKKVYVTTPQELMDKIIIDNNTFMVLMTHNYNYDLALLKSVVQCDFVYLGILGPKTKLNRMLDDLQADGFTITNAQLDCIYGPIGLDIGAETAEEIAVSVIAEIKAVLSGKKGTSLKYKKQKIHTAVPIL